MATRQQNRNKWLDSAVQKVLRDVPQDQRSVYAAALRDSLRLDLNQDNGIAACPSAETIWNDHGLNARTQLDFHIILTRPQCVDFLDSIGLHMTLATFQKRSGSEAYQAKFGRAAVQVRGFVLTYAEVLHLADHLLPVTYPPELTRYLPD